MSVDELTRLTLCDVAARIKRRELSAVTVTEAVLERIHRLNPQLNAFITVMNDEAMDAARVAEAEITKGDYRGPLHGVPISLKDLLYTRGTRTTAGSRILMDFVPDRDATAVQRLRAAGAVLVGKTNMLEFAYGEVHPDYGPALNPWNTGYGTSGSSSGSGASVAAGLDYGSLGSDTGGSIRFPAAYCGIVGLKPTYGLVSRAGAVPLAWSLDHVGPMTRTVRDCAILLQAVAGYDPADPASARVSVSNYANGLDDIPQDAVIGVVEPTDDDGVTGDVRRATEVAVDALGGLGFRMKRVALPHPVQTARAILALMYAEASTYHASWLRTRPDDYSPNTRERLQLGTLLPATLVVRASRVRQVIVDAYRDLFRQIDILVTPTSPFASYRIEDAPAEPVRDSGDRMMSLVRFTGPFNATGQPAITIPCGLTEDGLPIGVQLVGRPFAELNLLQVAHALEHELTSSVSRNPDNLLLV
ncbi:MAG: amidase [Chloroflexota bacterium]|nr:amidase [Chloroflexota bacterium]